MATSALVTALLVRWGGGYVEVEDAAGITAFGRIVGFVKLGEIQSAEQATVIGQSLLAKRSIPPAAVQADIEPDVDSTPFADFNVGDTIDCPDEDLVGQPTRVISIGFTEDDVGDPIYSVELAARHLEPDERMHKWLSRMSRGALDGTVLAASPVAPAAEPATKVGEGGGAPNEILFSLGGDLRLSTSGRYTERVSACSVGGIFASLATGGTTDTVVDVLRNGVQEATLTIPAGANTGESSSPPIALAIDDYLQARVDARGAGARDLVVQAYRL